MDLIGVGICSLELFWVVLYTAGRVLSVVSLQAPGRVDQHAHQTGEAGKTVQGGEPAADRRLQEDHGTVQGDPA